jgi:hypothetical protein
VLAAGRAQRVGRAVAFGGGAIMKEVGIEIVRVVPAPLFLPRLTCPVASDRS